METNAEVDLGIEGLTPGVVIGRGGFGVVYRCDQPRFGRTVAVKVLPPDFGDEAAQRRFDRECQAMGRLSGHPHIVTLYAAGLLPSGQRYLVMDYLPAGSLADVVARSEPLSPERALAAAVMLAGALETAHGAGILHRDVKPENALLSAYGSVQLTDFGISRIAGSWATRTTGVTASLAHAAPELLGGADTTVRSDVYALGSTLFALLSGSPAFVKPDDTSILPLMARVASEPVPDLTIRGVPAPVAGLVERLMAKEPLDRPATAEAAGRELQAVQRALGVDVTPLAGSVMAAERASDTVRGLAPLHRATPPAPDPARAPTQPPSAVLPGAAATGPRRRMGVVLAAAGAGAAVVAGALLVPGVLDDRAPAPTASPAVATEVTSRTADPSEDADPSQASDAAESPVPQEQTAEPAGPVGPAQRLQPVSVTASSTAPDGFDSAGDPVTYAAANLVDTDLTTTWRASGDAVGDRIELRFSTAVRVDRVGLVPGYAKVDPVDGTDRFLQNRRVRRARVEAGNAVVEATFAEEPVLQSVELGGEVVTDLIVVTILESVGPADRDFTAISEIDVLGRR